MYYFWYIFEIFRTNNHASIKLTVSIFTIYQTFMIELCQHLNKTSQCCKHIVLSFSTLSLSPMINAKFQNKKKHISDTWVMCNLPIFSLQLPSNFLIWIYNIVNHKWLWNHYQYVLPFFKQLIYYSFMLRVVIAFYL